MSRLADEEKSLRDRYRRRDARGEARYSVFEPSYLLALQQRDRIILKRLAGVGISDLSGLKILDAGCGSGHEILRLILWGAKPENLTGIDLVPERCEAARRIDPSISIVNGNLATLPFPDSSFDLVLQFTTFSSILDPAVRAQAAGEINRVLVPGGHLVWYDFWLNPINRDTRGIRPKEIRKLFPGYRGAIQRLTLAPPIARAIASRSRAAIWVLQALWPLQTHYVGVLQRPLEARAAGT